ncbi:hypothetical protein QBC37DRAFT_296179 [Rhypophila decipiens]|uniref:2-dehydropantoate 2-reductase n=1 Tax=Rhypophila decipiens TaxID=261697 RepID=A0AAN6XXY2_9PEZI|nr:hypothetical protein QBC37DRAFT_296179 [Rhypophila decipiens]
MREDGQRSTPTWEGSEQIYVMGSDLVGRYIAFLLAGTETIPPIRYLIHRMNLWNAWENCGRQLQIQRITGVEKRNRVKAEFMSMKASPPLPGPLIPNLIITVPPGSVVGALAPIKHRLDHRSTICLVHHGLGAMEAIIEAHFPDQRTRPAFLLGHMTAKVRQFKGHFSATEVEDGRLYLTIPTTRGGSIMRKHPPPERTVRFTNLMSLLMTIPELNASSHPFPDFLKHKLPSLALLSIAEPLAAICEVPYEDLLRHDTTRHLMAIMLSEVCAVVSKMPECRREGSPLSFLSVFLQKKFYKELHNQKKSQPRLDMNIYRAWETDINYLTGYFIHRAEELNIRVPILKAVLQLLKAKRHFAAEDLERVIPFEEPSVQLLDDLAPGQQS